MLGIDLLIKEHERIIEFTNYLKKLCCDVIEGKEVDVQRFRECVEFGRNYADKQHHGKEEKILFRVMVETLGTVAEKLINQGMLVEHDLGRYHMGELLAALERYESEQSTEGKLDIITHAAAYADLLKRHIEKEDSVCYTFAARMLSEEDKKLINEETERFEEESRKNGVQSKYETWLKELSIDMC